ncbi:hypothetical protein ACROYT_G019207 [Oculina patagonica]
MNSEFETRSDGLVMASTPFSSTKETTNYARLCRLLVDVGSQVLREAFDKIHPPSRLHTVLAHPVVHGSLQSLLKKRIINQTQWSKLYPAVRSSVLSTNFDVTLLMILFRNICNLLTPATGWDTLPPATDTSLEADIVRIKFYRNTVYAHANQASVDDASFRQYWQDIRDTLVRLGGTAINEEAIDSLANDSMDPDIEQHYQELLRAWKKDEDSMKDKLDEIEKKLDDLANLEKRTRLTEPFDLEECQNQLHSLYDTMSKVKTIPWNRNSAVHIDEIYTQLSWVREDWKPSGVTQEKLEDYTDIFQGHRHHPNPKRILVFGRPGFGKTTFSKKIAFDWSQRRREILKKFHLVLLIRLRDVCALHDVPAILKAAKLLTADGVISGDSLYNYVLQNQEKVLLVLDGYDEYACTGEHSPVRDIWEGTLLRNCHVIITTRLANADKLRISSHIQLQINGFDGNRIKKFASKFLENEEDVDEFVKHLKEKELTDIAEIPLLLLMLCLLWKEKHEKLTKSRAVIYTNFIQTLLDHMTEKDANTELFGKVDDYKEELSKLGKLAFDALLHDSLFLRAGELPDDVLIKNLIETGLFQLLNISSLNPEKGVYFLHKSIQEFFAALYLKEELLNRNFKSNTCLSEIDSFQKIVKMSEALKFACELSAEAACAILHHLGIVGKEEGLTKYNFCEAPSIDDLSEEHLLKSSLPPNYVFFADSEHPEQDYCDLITVLENLNGLLVSCSGEEEASHFLKKHPPRSVEHFFLKKEEKMYLYFARIYKRFDYTFPIEMLKDLTSKKLVGDQSNEQHNTTALCLTTNTESTPVATRHSLSLVWEINAEYLEEQEMKTLTEALPFVTSPRLITISVQVGKVLNAQLLETLVSSIKFTNRLHTLGLWRINLTAKPANVIARSLYQAPNLRELYLSYNPFLGDGVSVLAQHLRYVPQLKSLRLGGVKMTKTQVTDLTRAVRQSNISSLGSYYHDEEGNPKPEHEWPLEDDWKRFWWYKSEDELGAEASTDSQYEQVEPGK